MAISVLAETAAAVLDGLEKHTFSLPFQAERSYADWELQLEDLATLKVDVVPVSSPDFTLETRGSISLSPQVDIVIRKRLGQEARRPDGRFIPEVIDELVLLTEEIAAYFATNRFEVTDSQPIWQNTELLSAYRPSHLRQYQQYTGIVRLTFTASIDIPNPLPVYQEEA